MTVREVQEILEAWAPPDIAWEHDNVGLQVGDPDLRVRSILVALDATEDIIAEAVRRGANLIITHHPLLFRPLRSISPVTSRGRCVIALAQHGIALYSAHTNLDFTRGGTSFALADAIGLIHQEFLRKPFRLMNKIVTFVPSPQAEDVALAMANAGAGVIGAYDRCSFRTEGTGSFRGGPTSRPTIGSPLVQEHVPEVRLEMIAPRRKIGEVVRALVMTHPYEESAYDVYPLENVNTDSGMGVIGDLPKPVSLTEFLRNLRRVLGSTCLRHTDSPRAKVRCIAVCGGGGSELLEDAITSGADVFVTADVKYHTFHDADGRIAIVDAGHHETEFPVVGAVVERLRRALVGRGKKIPVQAATRPTNPVRQAKV